MKKFLPLMFCTALIVTFATSACADFKLDPLFTDNMVVQRDRPVVIRGTADSGEKIYINFAGMTKYFYVNKDGPWRVELPPLKAGNPGEMLFHGTTRTLVLKNVAVGDVWLCSGQSNMETDLGYYETHFPDKVTSAAFCDENPNLRLYRLACNYASAPVEYAVPAGDAFGKTWRVSDEAGNREFSAAGYYFGAALQADTGIPIGLIQSAVGGSIARAWTPWVTMATDRSLKPFLDSVKASDENRLRPSLCYNGMIAPLTDFPIKGIVWYQGESDSFIEQTYSHTHYAQLLAAMVKAWRDKWKDPKLPFIQVVLAGYDGITSSTPGMPLLANIREQQIKAAELIPDSALVTAQDLGMRQNIHPPFKRQVGERLAMAAKRLVYGAKTISGYAPELKSAEVTKDNKLELTFDNVGNGLCTKDVNLDGTMLSAAKIEGIRVSCMAADIDETTATISGTDKVIIDLDPMLGEPILVQYGWADFPVGNLYNKEGSPVLPFYERLESKAPDKVKNAAPPAAPKQTGKKK